MVNAGPRPEKKPSFLGPFHATRELENTPLIHPLIPDASWMLYRFSGYE